LCNFKSANHVRIFQDLKTLDSEEPFFGTPDVEIGDGGIAYVFYSETTGQTELVVQDY